MIEKKKLYTVFWTITNKPTLCFGINEQDALASLKGNLLGTMPYLFLIVEGDQSDKYVFDSIEGTWNAKSS